MPCINRYRCAGALYVSSNFVNRINKKPGRTETKTIQTLMNTSSKKIPIYSVQISDETPI